MRTALAWSVVTSLSVWLQPLPSAATTVVAYDLEELIARSDEVVSGYILSKRYRESDDGKLITEYKFRINETLKGSCKRGEITTIYELGGVKDGIGMKVHGTTDFVVKAEYLLFARSQSDGEQGLALSTVGMSQGAMPITFDKKGNKTIRPGVPIHTVRQDERGKITRQRPALDKAMPLNTFTKRVREVVAAHRARY